MANFQPKPIDLGDINGGQRYVNGDFVSPDAINDTVEAAAYACEMVENVPVDAVSEHDVAELVASSLEVGEVTKSTDADVQINVVDGKAVIDFTLPTAGTAGADGTTFYPSVSSAGVISWTNDGGKQNPASVDLVAAVIAALPVYDGTGD